MDNKQIDREFRKEELKHRLITLIKPAIVLAMIIFGLLLMFFVSPKTEENHIELLNGKTLYETPVSESYDYDSAMIVQLVNDEEVRVAVKMVIEFKKDKNIEIQKITSPDGTVSYDFSRYIDD